MFLFRLAKEMTSNLYAKIACGLPVTGTVLLMKGRRKMELWVQERAGLWHGPSGTTDKRKPLEAVGGQGKLLHKHSANNKMF